VAEHEILIDEARTDDDALLKHLLDYHFDGTGSRTMGRRPAAVLGWP
jgi:hypothetical protein